MMATCTKEMNKQHATHEDGQYDVNDAKEAFRQCVATRQETIEILREQARIADNTHLGCSLSNRNASVTGAIGGALTILAGGITVASGGLAIPFVISCLTGIGTTCSVGGGAWSIKNEYDRSQRNSSIQQELLQQLSKDEKARRQMNNIFNGIEKGYYGEPKKIFRELHTILAGMTGIGNVFGSTAAITALPKMIRPLASYISRGSTTALSVAVPLLDSLSENAELEGMKAAVEESASLAVEDMPNGFSKDFVRRMAVKAANKAYKKVLEDGLEEAAKKAAEEAAKKAAQEAAKKAAQEAAKKAAEEAAKKAAQEAAKKAAEEAAKKAAQEAAKKAAEEAAKKAAQEAAKKTAEEAAKKAAQEAAKKAAQEAAKKAAEKAAKKAAEKAAKKAAEEAARKAAEEAAKKTAEEAAKKAAEEAAKKAAEEAAKKTARKATKNAALQAAQEGKKIAAKRVGTLTMGFGAFSCVWEGYNAYQNHYASQDESELGKELRCLANKLEECLQLA